MTQGTGAAVVQLVLLTYWRNRPHTQTCSCRVNFQSPWARTITHYPLTQPLPPTQGWTSQQPRRVGQLRPRTTTCTPSEFTSLFLFPFSSASSPLLCLLRCLFLSFFFFKLVHRTRWGTARCPRCRFDDVISVVLRGRCFSGVRGKKSQHFLHGFVFVFYLSPILLFL